MAEHPFMPVRTSFHTVCLGVKHPSHRGAPWCNGATARRRLRVLHHGAPRWLHLPRAGSGGGSKVKAHVLALICPFTACCGSLWVAIGALVASAPGVQAEEGRALHVTDDTARHPRYTSRAKREADVSLSHVCTMEHPVAPWKHHDATGVTIPRQTVKASPHRHKWMLSHSAPADPSDPWNSHAAPVSPRQNGCATPNVNARKLRSSMRPQFSA